MSETGDIGRYVLLLRGINVGGNKKLLMNDLKEMIRELGFNHVNHYIQSGNLVFSTSVQSTQKLESTVEKGIDKRFGFDVPAIVLSAQGFETAVQRFPFSTDEAEKTVLVFLSGEDSGDWADRAEERVTGDEKYDRTGNVAYLYCANGIERSKAARAVLTKPRAGIKATMRNWRTVNKILDLLSEMPKQTGSASYSR